LQAREIQTYNSKFDGEMSWGGLETELPGRVTAATVVIKGIRLQGANDYFMDFTRMVE